MSTLKVEQIQHPSSSTPAITLDSNGAMSGSFPYPNRNLLYNGAMQVHQRGTSTAGITAGGQVRVADRWRSGPVVSGTWTETIENDAPLGSGFRKSLKLLCTTANASLSANSVMTLNQRLEGQDLQGISKGTPSAKQLTMSFWVKSNVTGTYVAEIYDTDNTRQVSANYTINGSNVWERKIIVFAADTTGILDNDNNMSVQVFFFLTAGTDFSSGTLNTVWDSVVSANRAVGQVNVAAATNNYWQITGVQLETGSVATEFEHRSYGDELARCQRYYYKHVEGNAKSIGAGSYYNSSIVLVNVSFPVTMRANPSLVATSGTDYYKVLSNGDLFNAFVASRVSENVGTIEYNSGIAGSQGYASDVITNNANSSIAYSAEL